MGIPNLTILERRLREIYSFFSGKFRKMLNQWFNNRFCSPK